MSPCGSYEGIGLRPWPHGNGVYGCRPHPTQKKSSDRSAALRVALKELGYEDCYHMMSASVENPPDCLMWQDALSAKYDGVGTFGREQWDQLLGHCQAVCDWPAVAFAKELIQAYPEAKVILTTRDVDSWYASTMKTVHWRATEPQLRILAMFDWGAGLYQPMLNKFWDVFWNGDFRRNGKQRFKEYYEEVRSIVPTDNLLEYRIEEGWTPLCHFLKVSEPHEKRFPWSNDTDGFVQRCRRRNRSQMLNVAFRAALTVGVAGAVVLGGRRVVRSLVGLRRM